jgi:hypothetical protein
MIDLNKPCVLSIKFTSLLKRLEFNTPMGWITQPSFDINLPYPCSLPTISNIIVDTLGKVEAVPLANDAGYQELANAANEKLAAMKEGWDEEELIEQLTAQLELELNALRLIYEVDVNRTGVIITVEISDRDDLEDE